MNLQQTSYLLLLKVIHRLGKLNGEMDVATLIHILSLTISVDYLSFDSSLLIGVIRHLLAVVERVARILRESADIWSKVENGNYGNWIAFTLLGNHFG